MKYIIFDLDDTLLNDKGEVSERTKKGLERLKKQGHVLIINTARSFKRSIKVMREIRADYGIFNGGAHIVDALEKTIYQVNIKQSVVTKIARELFEKCDGVNVDFDYLYCNDKEYVLAHKDEDFRYFDFNKNFEMEANKILAASNDTKLIENIAHKYDLDVINYVGSEWHRLCLKGISKWSGVLELLNIIQGAVEDTITFGDDSGDLEMLMYANIGVAMANSRKVILDNIKIVTKSNDEDGVIHYLEEVLGL